MSGLHGVQALFDGEPDLVPGTLRGFRTWGGLSRDGRLSSTGMSHHWAPAPFGGGSETARCLRSLGMPQHAEEAPGRDCPCGLYGWYSPDDTRIVTAAVLGVVQATGRVILGSHGFRAERLEVLAVTTFWPNPELLAALEQQGYPTVPDRDALLVAFPPDDVTGLVDHACTARCEAQSGIGTNLGHLHVALGISVADFEDVIKKLAQQVSAAATSVQAFLDGIGTAEGEDPEPHTLRQRALDAVRNRGTGPRPVPFAKRGRS